MNLSVSSSPHIRDSRTTQSIMLDVIIALMPALIAAFFIFGTRALMITAVSVISCVLFELLWNKMTNKPATISDLSAVVTGILIAYNMPEAIPLWIPVIGAAVAMFLVKGMFGGLGHNFANPAITARIVLLLSFGGAMNKFTVRYPYAAPGTMGSADILTSATPLALMRAGETVPSYMKLFLGQHAGVIGEVSAAALLLGCAYLVIRGVIDLWIPASFIGTVALIGLMTGNDPVFHVLAGGLMLGAIFMATDYVTTPITTKGKIIFGIGCGVITGLIRYFGSSPEGVSYAILVMNIFAPHIKEWTKTLPVGGVKRAEG